MKNSKRNEILRKAILSTTYHDSKEYVNEVVSGLFDAETVSMNPETVEYEKTKMAALINRYHAAENEKFNINGYELLAQDKQVDVEFFGETYTVTVDRLIVRENQQYEALRYIYESPRTSYRSKKNYTPKSLELLLLQLAGEKLLAEMGIRNARTSGAVYSMTSRYDTTTLSYPIFDPVANIAKWSFTPSGIKDMSTAHSVSVA